MQRRTILRLERLEDRTAPAIDIFQPPGVSTDWSDPNNWSLLRVPGPNDTAIIRDAQTAVLASGEDATIQSLNVNTGTLDVSGKLDVSASATFIGVGTVTIEKTGDLDDSGTLDSSLTNMGSPPLGIIVNGKLEFDSTATQAGISGPLNIVQNQSLGIDGDVEVGTSATISSNNVLIGGILDAKNINAFGGAAINLTGTGEILNSGNIETGILATATFTHFSNYTIDPGGELHGDGTYVIDGPVTVAGNLSQPGAMQLNNDDLTTEGSLVGGGSLELNEDFTWTGGTISLGGGVSLPINSEFTIAGPNTCTLATTLTNIASNRVEINSPLTLAANAVLNNDASGFALSLSSTISGAGTFDNLGTLECNSTTTAPAISSVFNQSGSGSIEMGAGAQPLTLSGTGTLAGDLTLNSNLIVSGAYTVTAGTKLETLDTSDGVFDLTTNGTLTLNAGSTTDIDYFRLDGGTLAGDGTLTIGESGLHPDNYFDWYSGTLSGTGTLDIVGIIWNNQVQGCNLNLLGTGPMILSGWTIENSGIVDWTGGMLQLTNFNGVAPTLDNEGKAIFKDEGTGTFQNMTTGATFDNHGYFLKDSNSGTGTLALPMIFNNDPANGGGATDGLVEVKSGSVSLSGGGSSSGTFQADSGSTVQFTQAGYTLTGGALAGAGTITNTATLTVSGSTALSGGVTLNNANGAQMQVSADVTAGTGGGTIHNAGTFTTTAGTTTATISAIFDNTSAVETQAGTLTFAGGGGSSGFFQIAAGTTLQFTQQGYTITTGMFMGAGTIDNQTLLKLEATMYISQTFNNEGTLEEQTSTLSLNGGGSSASGSSFISDSGAVVAFGNGTYTLGGGTTLNGSGAFQVTGGVVVVTGTVTGASGMSLTLAGGTLQVTDTGSLQVGSFTEQSGATLEIDLGATSYGTLDVQGVAALAGALDVVLTGYVPAGRQPTDPGLRLVHRLVRKRDGAERAGLCVQRHQFQRL